MVEIFIEMNEGELLVSNFVRILNAPDAELSMVVIGFSRMEELIVEILELAKATIQARTESKVKELHRLGLIDEDMRDCLFDLGRIRNHFAHNSKQCTLGDGCIQNDVRQLVTLLEKGFMVGASVDTLHNKIQSELDRQTVPGNQWAGKLSPNGEKIRSGFFFLGLQLLAAKQSAVSGATAPVGFGSFTVRTGA